jgi:hypothetical protein
MLVATNWVLRVLLVLNILLGIPLLLLLGFTFAQESRFLAILAGIFAGGDLPVMLSAARWSLAIVAPVMLFAHLLLRRLLEIIGTVEAGEPFIPANANRLRTVAWCLLAIQLCDIAFGLASARLDMAAGERVSGWSPGLTGWVAVLLVFVLARVFREGTRLRSDAELTI